MDISNQATLRVCHIRDHRVVGSQAGCGTQGVCGVTRQQKMLREVQQAQMSPIAGMEFLTME